MDYSGAVFFDYDGTLSDEIKGIYYPTKATISAAEKLKAKGYFVCLATGRSKCYTPDCGIDFDGYITCNGAYAEKGGREVQSITIPYDFLCEIMEYFKEKGIYYSAETQKRCYARDKNEKTFKSMIENFNIPADIFDPIDEMDKDNVSKMLFAYPSEDTFFDIKKHFEKRLKIDRHRFFPSADAGLFGVTKATGVKALISALGVSLENTYAFGDGTNDIEMMKAVGHPIAMGVSADALKEICETVTDTVENEGISKALKKYGPI